eukprot:gene20034-22769_t
MFIKKDRRKINEIFREEGSAIESLKLSKRKAEFQGTLRIICHESKAKLLGNLKVLNLYDNDLNSADGIGILAQTPVEDINLGCNKLTKLPLEFGTVRTLTSLWLDDNQFESFPTCVCQLKELKNLHLSGNTIKTVPSLISSLENLETLAMDSNELVEFPSGCLLLPELKNLWIRQNKIVQLPDNLELMASLQVLSLSSNLLEELPDAVASLHSLRQLFANGNRIKKVPENLCLLPELKEVNLSNNQLSELPPLWESIWGSVDPATGLLTVTVSVTEKDNKESKGAKVLLLGNPLLTAAA